MASSLNLEPVESYLRVLAPLNDEIKLVSSHLKGIADDDEDMKLLMTIPGIGYYSALWSKVRLEMLIVSVSEIGFVVMRVLCRLRMLWGQWVGTGTSLRRAVVGCVRR